MESKSSCHQVPGAGRCRLFRERMGWDCAVPRAPHRRVNPKTGLAGLSFDEYRTGIQFLFFEAHMPEPRHNPPKQARSQRTLERIEQATLDLIAEKGVEATSVHDIVKRARRSVGSFYARFAGKEDLLLHLEEKVWSSARERFDEALEERDFDGIALSAIIEPLVQLVLDSHREDARQRRFLDLRNGVSDLGAGMRRFHAHILARIRPLLLARQSEILHPIPERSVDLGFAAVVGAIRVLEEGTLEEGARAGLSDESVVHELARLYRSYLGGGRSLDDAPPQMEFFDIWE